MLLQEEIAFLIDERRDKEVEDIFNNKMGVIHPIRYDGHDILASRPTKKYSQNSM